MALQDSVDILKVAIQTGSGTPTHSAFPGTIYVNVTGTTTVTHLFVNNSSTVNTPGTSWTPIVTVST